MGWYARWRIRDVNPTHTCQNATARAGAGHGKSHSQEEASLPPFSSDYKSSVAPEDLRPSKYGLAKPMGLVEGPGGLGQGGAAATLGEDIHDAEGKYEEYGYNAQLSDRISLDRSIPDYRPKKVDNVRETCSCKGDSQGAAETCG
ncbi:unnamed protein product [Pleuronectes platessa]|uniref:Uncharacterized protein n=1 Tax=Pleuronectes platessa TaxID=8262 RepID=A0A9N7V8K8_PLEPL|nr:unnamed protein product [Pleuronectes platessa]